MNYYFPQHKQLLYLYNKVSQQITRIFENERELEEWIVQNLLLVGFGYWRGTATDLTMDINAPPIHVYEHGYIEYKKHLVIISDYKSSTSYSVYNYTSLINKIKDRIINGYDNTYIDRNQKETKNRNAPEFRKGAVPYTGKRKHYSCSYLIVNKAERAAYSQPLEGEYYNRETDSFIEYDLPQNIKGMRRARWQVARFSWDDYARRSNHDTHKRHRCWKNFKKARQWM